MFLFSELSDFWCISLLLVEQKKQGVHQKIVRVVSALGKNPEMIPMDRQTTSLLMYTAASNAIKCTGEFVRSRLYGERAGAVAFMWPPVLVTLRSFFSITQNKLPCVFCYKPRVHVAFSTFTSKCTEFNSLLSILIFAFLSPHHQKLALIFLNLPHSVCL